MTVKFTAPDSHFPVSGDQGGKSRSLMPLSGQRVMLEYAGRIHNADYIRQIIRRQPFFASTYQETSESTPSSQSQIAIAQSW